VVTPTKAAGLEQQCYISQCDMYNDKQNKNKTKQIKQTKTSVIVHTEATGLEQQLLHQPVRHVNESLLRLGER
jgi:hypothetical protein